MLTIAMAQVLSLLGVLFLVLQVCVLARAQNTPNPPKTGTFPYADIQVHYQMYVENKNAPLVVFLHGAKYNSDTWVKIGSLALLREQGYKAIAIDLPGYGKTQKLAYVDENARAELVLAAVKFVQQGSKTSLILVSPSMSGKWAMPFIDRHGTELAGWVALAPIGVRTWPGPSAQVHRKVKLLAMYGENDRLKQDSAALTKLFANSLLKIIPGAGHPCYVDKPHEFHRDLLAFLRSTAPAPPTSTMT